MPSPLPIALSSNMHHHYHNPMHHHHNHTTMPNTLHNSLYNALFHHFPHHNCTCEGLCTLPKVSSLPSLQASSSCPPGTCTQAICAPALLRSCSSVPTSYP